MGGFALSSLLGSGIASILPLGTLSLGPEAAWSIPCVSVAFFPSLKQNFMVYRSSKVSSRPGCIFKIYQQWQSGFSRVYSNCFCSCSFKPAIIKIGQWSHKMDRNNIVNFQESTTILNACTKKSLESYWRHLVFSPAISFCFVFLNFVSWWVCGVCATISHTK